MWQVGEILQAKVFKPVKLAGTRWVAHRERALKDFAEVLNNSKKLSTRFCKEEEFMASESSVELTSSIFGLS